jgi:hypothetical protein
MHDQGLGFRVSGRDVGHGTGSVTVPGLGIGAWRPGFVV